MSDQPTTPEPTDQDRRNAETRRAIADGQLAEYTEALKLALGTLGPGWMPWMKLVLIDADHRQSGNREPVATVYKVYRGEERLTENSVFLRRMPDGTVQQASNYEELFSDLLTEKHPTRGFQLKGEWIAYSKWTLCWSALERYEPRSADQLAAARVKREERKVEKEAVENPLFADQIRTGEWRPEKTPRKR